MHLELVGNRSISRACSTRLSSRPLTSSPRRSCEVTTSQRRPRPIDAEVLNDRLEIQHLLDITGDELANLVDDEQQGLAWAPPLHELVGALGEHARA